MTHCRNLFNNLQPRKKDAVMLIKVLEAAFSVECIVDFTYVKFESNDGYENDIINKV